MWRSHTGTYHRIRPTWEPTAGRRHMFITSKLQKLREMSRAEHAVVLRAGVALPIVAAGLRVWSLGTIQSRLSPVPGVSHGIDPSRVAFLVEKVASNHVYRANCLERSLVLWWLLEREGIRSEIRFGVRPSRNGAAPDFHAWVEKDGNVLNDRPDIADEFLPFDDPIGPPPGRLV